MIVQWTHNAKRQLRIVHDTITQQSARSARAVVDRITRRTQQLQDHPKLGAEVPEYESELIRELLEHPYRIIYRILEDRVEVVSVIHGAQDLPGLLEAN